MGGSILPGWEGVSCARRLPNLPAAAHTDRAPPPTLRCKRREGAREAPYVLRSLHLMVLQSKEMQR